MMFFYKVVGVHMGPNLCVWLISQRFRYLLKIGRTFGESIQYLVRTCHKFLPQGSEANPLLTQMEIHIQNCKLHV